MTWTHVASRQTRTHVAKVDRTGQINEQTYLESRQTRRDVVSRRTRIHVVSRLTRTHVASRLTRTHVASRQTRTHVEKVDRSGQM